MRLAILLISLAFPLVLTGQPQDCRAQSICFGQCLSSIDCPGGCICAKGPHEPMGSCMSFD